MSIRSIALPVAIAGAVGLLALTALVLQKNSRNSKAREQRSSIQDPIQDPQYSATARQRHDADSRSVFDTLEPESEPVSDPSFDRESYPVDVDNLGASWLARATQTSSASRDPELERVALDEPLPTLDLDDDLESEFEPETQSAPSGATQPPWETNPEEDKS